MSISGITSSGTFNQVYNSTTQQQRLQAFQQLGQALQSGNLSQAQQAFGLLTANGLPTGAAANTPIGQDLSALGQALQSGNLPQAQQAFAQLQSALQNFRAHHHHHHHGQGGINAASAANSSRSQSATDSDGDSDGSGSGSGSLLNITA